jgi:hypothetical protein
MIQATGKDIKSKNTMRRWYEFSLSTPLFKLINSLVMITDSLINDIIVKLRTNYE